MDDNITRNNSTNKRIHHFTEWLEQIDDHNSIVDTGIIAAIKKQCDISECSYSLKNVKLALKVLKMNKYWENVPYIKARLNNEKPTYLSSELKTYLQESFIAVWEAYNRYLNNVNICFFSYHFVVKKLLELALYNKETFIINTPEILDRFTYLKSIEKRNYLEKRWQITCHQLNWQYIYNI